MNDTELEAMHVRLYGDGSSYQNMLQQATGSSRVAAQRVEQYSSKVEGFGTSLKGFASAAMAAMAVLGATSFLHSAFDKFATYETTLIRLSSTIRGNGGDVEAILPQYKAFAKQLKETSGISGEATLDLLRTAESYRLSGDAAKRATQDAVALSYATRGNADAAGTMMRMTAAMASGNTRLAMQMGRMVPQLREFRGDAIGFQQAYQRLITTGLATSVDVMNSATGVLRRYSMVWSMLKKQFGEFVAEAAVPVIKYLTLLVESFTKLDEGTRRIVVWSAFVVAGLLAVAPAVGTIMAVMGPVLGAVTAGFTAIAGAVSLLASPIAIASGLLGVLGSVVAIAFSPVGIVLATAATAITLFVAQSGGVVKAWNRVRDGVVASVVYVRACITDFVTWIEPYWNAAAYRIATVWGVVGYYANVAWETATSALTSFVAWAAPYWTRTVEMLSAVWGSLSAAGVAAWNYVGETVRHFIEVASAWMAPYVGTVTNAWRVIGDIAGTVWMWITSRVQTFVAQVTPLLGTVVDTLVIAFGTALRIGGIVFDGLTGIIARFTGRSDLSSWVDGVLAALTWVADTGMSVFTTVADKVNWFVGWVSPILLQFANVGVAAFELLVEVGLDTWDSISVGAAFVWSFISDTLGGAYDYWAEVFHGLLGDAEITWDGVQDAVVEALIIAEFSIRNIGRVWDLTLAFVTWRWAQLNNVVTFFFADVIPALLRYMSNNWMAVWRSAFDIVLLGMSELSFSNLINLIMGRTSFAAIRQRVERGMRDALVGLPPIDLPVRVPTALENELRREFERLGTELAGDYQTFRARRLAEIGRFEFGTLAGPALEDARQVAENAGTSIGQALNRGVEKQVAKFDAVLTKSREALYRVYEYQESLTKASTIRGRVAAPFGTPAPPAIPQAPAAPFGAPAPPAVPAVPAVPGAPAVPAVPQIPAVPQVPAMPGAPAMAAASIALAATVVATQIETPIASQQLVAQQQTVATLRDGFDTLAELLRNIRDDARAQPQIVFEGADL